ncbi:MAG: hypothetical protein IPI27_05610 [Betaproteobacteria bacterium]|nr:hypothetical protein [Betaproteobacteria bacterium]
MKKIGLALAGAYLLGATTIPAMASPITYEFTVVGTTGSMTGVTSTGTFTYDTASVPVSLPGVVDGLPYSPIWTSHGMGSLTTKRRQTPVALGST